MNLFTETTVEMALESHRSSRHESMQVGPHGPL